MGRLELWPALYSGVLPGRGRLRGIWPDKGISGQTDGQHVGARAEDGGQLLAKAVLWLHVSLYQLKNGRIGGRFIANSPAEKLGTATAAEPVKVQQGNRLR